MRAVRAWKYVPRDAKTLGWNAGNGTRDGSQPVSRVLSRVIIPLGCTSPCTSSDLPESGAGPHHRIPIWSCSGWGLPCRSCYHQRGALLPHLFTLTYPTPKDVGWRYIFCGTFRRLTPPRRYLAPCPMEPGLSSIPHRLPTPTMTTETGPRSPGRLPPPQHRPTGKRRQVGYSALIAFELLQH